MRKTKMLGRDFIQAMKPMLGIAVGIKSLTIRADVNEMAIATVEVLVNNGDTSIEEVKTPDETETRRFIFDVTEVDAIDLSG
jgi:hypothetical protein